MSKYSTAQIFKLLTLHFPSFSEKQFQASSLLEKVQWLYLLIYRARFEFISHFLFGPYSNYIKSPEEFFEGLFYGQGGVCLERVMALKYAIELFEIGTCRFVIGGSLPGTHQKIDISAVKANLLDPTKKSISSYAHHAALIVNIQGDEWLLDPNGGRLGQIFVNPSLTLQLLTDDALQKLGVMASFGQMFYHNVPEELFYLMVAYRRGSSLETLDLICRVGFLVGNNFDLFLVPRDEASKKISSLYPHRVQTMCWQVRGSLLDAFRQHNLVYPKTPGEDRFLEKIDSAFALLNDLSISSRQIPLQMILRIATAPWDHFTQIASPISSAFMMR